MSGADYSENAIIQVQLNNEHLINILNNDVRAEPILRLILHITSLFPESSNDCNIYKNDSINKFYGYTPLNHDFDPIFFKSNEELYTTIINYLINNNELFKEFISENGRRYVYTFKLASILTMHKERIFMPMINIIKLYIYNPEFNFILNTYLQRYVNYIGNIFDECYTFIN